MANTANSNCVLVWVSEYPLCHPSAALAHGVPSFIALRSPCTRFEGVGSSHFIKLVSTHCMIASPFLKIIIITTKHVIELPINSMLVDANESMMVWQEIFFTSFSLNFIFLVHWVCDVCGHATATAWTSTVSMWKKWANICKIGCDFRWLMFKSQTPSSRLLFIG